MPDKTTKNVVKLLNKLIKERDPYKGYERLEDGSRKITTISNKVYIVTSKSIHQEDI